MNLFFVGTVYGTTLQFRKELLQFLVAQGHAVSVFVTDWSCDKADLAKVELGVTLRSYPLVRAGTNPFADLSACWALYRSFRRLKPDVVLSFFAKPVIWGSIAAWLAGVPHRVGMLEGLGYTFTSQKMGFTPRQRLLQHIQVFLYRLSIPRLHRMIFLNPDDPRDLLERYRIKAKKVDVLGGIGVDLDVFAESIPPVAGGAGSRRVSFIFIARLLAEKGIHEFVAAARLVQQRYSSARFVVLGGLDDANPGGLKQKELDRLVADGVIEYPGFVSDVPVWVSDVDVFVLPSYREGVPRSTQEAMAIGRAVITTDVPGCRETVEEGVNGFLVAPWDAETLAEKMCHFIEHPEDIVRMGRESRRLAEERFDVREVNLRLCHILGVPTPETPMCNPL